MRELLNWNVPLGRWAGVQVRLHAFFVLFGIVALYLGTRGQKQGGLAETVAVVGVLFVSVLVHELGHCFVARRLGGSADQVLLWPLGGLIQVNVGHEPQHELFVALAGPTANFAVCGITAGPIWWALGPEGAKELGGMMRFAPPGTVAELVWFDLLRWTFWINWLLGSINLLPAFPWDGGRSLRCLIWPKSDYKTAVVWVGRIAMLMALGIAALGVCVAAGWTHGSEDSSYAALALLLLGLFLFVSAKQESERLSEVDPDDALFGYDFSQGYTSLERAGTSHKASPGVLRKYLEERRATRLRKQQQIEAEEERRVDDVLARLHEAGLHTLSDEDRALLDRVSARYRNRLRQ
ncbi:MAG TPA: M50 family metallopeptidase [Pirellulales bacterium]|jgi:Zn-dependent protease|nr:M50 family metallopeptidase [Pirellulales bacterium]